jgi:hypothetical protein
VQAHILSVGDDAAKCLKLNKSIAKLDDRFTVFARDFTDAQVQPAKFSHATSMDPLGQMLIFRAKNRYMRLGRRFAIIENDGPPFARIPPLEHMRVIPATQPESSRHVSRPMTSRKSFKVLAVFKAMNIP